MARRNIVIGCGPYDRMIALRDGAVETPGYTTTVRTMNVTDIPQAAFGDGTLDVAEISLGELLAKIESGDRRYTGIPAFPSMGFRHDCIYVARGSRIAAPADLGGARIGVTLHLGTTIIWVRQFLEAQFGLDLARVTWVVGKLATHVPAPSAPIPSVLPREAATDSLTAMLERGEIDALVSYQRPQGSRPDAFRRLLADPVAAASDYYRRFGTVPLLHLFAYRTTLRDADPGFPKMVLRALEQSKDVALDRLRDTACYTSSLPFLSATVEQATELMGPDFWPYGLERNRTALSTFLDAAFRQGLTTRRLTLADMFPDFAAS